MPSREYSEKYNLRQWMTVLDAATDNFLLKLSKKLFANRTILSPSRYALTRYALEHLLEENGFKKASKA